jgi:hypothetical protein
MSTALAIAGVTAVLQSYLSNLYAGATVADIFSGSNVTVSCLAPDQVQKLIDSGVSGGFPRANLFMHQVSHNAAWRNVDLASTSSDGTQRLSSPALALDLHYLLTAYGVDAWEAEALLGYALMMLHEAPVLTRDDVTNGLAAATSSLSHFNPTLAMNTQLALCGLADQVELAKITPEAMTREELAWLWTALKADYRPTFPFQVSVVLMQPDKQASFALPVLRVALAAAPEQLAQILAIQPASGQGTAAPGDQVTVTGEFLKGASQVELISSRFRLNKPLTAPPTQVHGGSLAFQVPAVPSPPNDYPAGLYQLQVEIPGSGGSTDQWTNQLPIAVAPVLPATQSVTAVPLDSGVSITIQLAPTSPPVWGGQSVVLSLNDLTGDFSGSAPAQPFVDHPPSLTFDFAEQAPPTGKNLLARIVVDGVSSQVSVTPPPLPPSPPPPPSFTFTGPWVMLL